MNLDDEGGATCEPVAADDGRLGLNAGHEFLLVGVIDIGEDQRREGTAERRRIDDGPITRDDTALFQAADPLDHGRTGEPDLLGQGFHRQSPMILEGGKNLLVQGIDLVRCHHVTFRKAAASIPFRMVESSMQISKSNRD